MQTGESSDHEDYDSIYGYMINEGGEESAWLDEKSYFRAKSAPARPLTEIEEFKKSKTFSIMERAVVSSTHLIQTYNSRYDIDSTEGQIACKTFLKLLEKLHENFKAKKANREYRDGFSNAYQMLYKGENSQLYYLNEIIDSAQEAVPCLYVNGQRFDFTPKVLEAGHRLFQAFIDIQHLIRKNYIRATYENSPNCVSFIQMEMMKALNSFDVNWTTYEMLYIVELMQIEAEARKYVTDAIKMDKEVQDFEEREKAKGTIVVDSEEYNELRTQLAEQISIINSVANYDGKGRDDLSVVILVSAESMLRTISPNQSKSVRKLAENIISSFQNIRLLLRKFDTNIEAVDPQLKNNQELVNLLLLYEKYWERGKHYFLDDVRRGQLVHFSYVLEGLCEKYDRFSKMIEYRDAEIFVLIPMVMILKSCEGDDRGICELFLPDISQQQSRNGILYNEVKQVIFENNQIFSLKQTDSKTRSNSLSKNLQWGRKTPHVSPDKWRDQRTHQSGAMSSELPPKNSKYKTILGNKSEYTTYSKPLKVPKEHGSAGKGCQGKKLNYTFYNLLEKKILGIDLSEKEQESYSQKADSLDSCIVKVRTLSIELERHDPKEWNTFLDVALES